MSEQKFEEWYGKTFNENASGLLQKEDLKRSWNTAIENKMQTDKIGQVKTAVKNQNGDQYHLLIDAITDLIFEDPHNWSSRPCQTCRAITTIIKKPFGCYKYAEQNKKC